MMCSVQLPGIQPTMMPTYDECSTKGLGNGYEHGRHTFHVVLLPPHLTKEKNLKNVLKKQKKFLLESKFFGSKR
jgi:hypothetical protein